MLHWYAIRACGVMALLLFTASTALGLVNRSRLTSERTPRFVIDRIHRNVALLALAFLVVHIITAVTDTFVSIPITSAFIPFAHSYRPLWVGLGTVAFELLVAVTVSSLVRQRLGFTTWRAIHWAAYLAWPVAVLHSIGNGTDSSTVWLLAIDVVCVGVVLAALAVRVTTVPKLGAV